jgi:uracil-DNA glycosylase family 4
MTSPKQCGARCDECPLGPNGALQKDEWRPVMGEFHSGAKILALGEAPRAEDINYGRPVMGSAAGEWSRFLATAGMNRSHVDLDNVIACKPPGKEGGAWNRMEKSRSAE